ncbi:glycosyltransferase family 2 protein [Candidatus Saccharibacteria bacterium]|nr:glycosyltransferase family 2 protein [Candidatus Saccharibacteria bacterium]
MKKLQIIMPMAGEGSRFVKQGWTTPKPLIEVKGHKLFERAINSIQVDQIDIKHTFIIRQEHADKYKLDAILKKIFPKANILFIKKTTRGAAETCYLAAKDFSPNDALLILDCDLEFRSSCFYHAIKDSIMTDNSSLDGALVSFKANSPRYSYAKIDANDFVTETAEKQVISENALCGAYFFSKNIDFLQATKVLFNSLNYQNKELYISLLFNEMIKANKKIKLFHTEVYHSFGTPEEIQDYYARNK